MQENNFIYGKNSVVEVLEKNPRRINKIFISKNIGLDNRMKKIKELAYQNSIIVQYVNLNTPKFPQNVNHQGVIASISPVSYMEFEDFLEKSKNKKDYTKAVILDGVQDPHNLGAVIRTCACAGFDAVIVPNHRACPLNATVEKTSSGAINQIDIVKVNSLSSTVIALKNNDWWIIATDAECKDNYFDIDYTNMNFAIVMGAEGTGVTRTIMKEADFRVKLPTNFESLNVSAACAVIVYESVRQNFLLQKTSLKKS